MLIQSFSLEEIEEYQPTKDEILISINDEIHQCANVQKGWLDILRLSFHDVDPYRYSSHASLIALQEDNEYKCFAKSHAEAIKNFLQMHMIHELKKICVHCTGGISRSVGVKVALELHYNHRDVSKKRQNLFYNRTVCKRLLRVLKGVEENS